MIVDYGFFFYRKVSVCLFNGDMVVGCMQRMSVVAIEVTDEDHICLHPDDDRRHRSYVERVMEDPKILLRSKGSTKTNLKLYVSFMTRGEYRPKVCGNKKQEIIGKIMNRSKEVLRETAVSDVHGYIKLCKVIGEAVEMPPSARLKQRITKLFGKVDGVERKIQIKDTLCDMIRNESDKLNGMCFILKVHHDFCIKGGTRDCISMFEEEYNKMLIKAASGMMNKVNKYGCDMKCMIYHALYPEVDLYNAFVACTNVADFDRSMLENRSLSTMNERGVRDAISNSIDWFYASLDVHD
ncbi:hypothetical protein CWI42_021260 [Ordospora colligata]|uniref:Uncharacterized protein n=1 Tax=Ordospora colligata OC4 TaxID=1354746 RepID=A0A0B2UM21_9MICR|nr:uncharacterized protein M896_021270 [Ordospora colligata OC4]KHN70289.1 hypothetical protein M896_021270 [Ordospora colligata OC4]TBU16833.1 hypothetical protein CWI41_021280 [Ordospora colligata]TBU16941.1 hypothetical protein CWI40_021280 [Ordospora colligata]TBU19382.1 hypothetical protein CWI42_021260 [Ordospora colligata]